MYSELTQQLDIGELESLIDFLEYSASTHARWIAKVNQLLVCRDNSTETFCADNPPHIHCQYSRWCDDNSNTSITTDPAFLKINILHENLHLIACNLALAVKNKQPISTQDYSKFTETQFDFLNSLHLLIKACTESLGIIDSLTNLPNKRAFQDILLQEENRIKRNKSTSVIALVDIDNFKAVNEANGYIAGDLLLIQLAAVFKNSLRNFDTVARYSGDQFTFYLPETDIKAAEVILERFRQTIENTHFEVAADTHTNITCSFGLSLLNSNLTSAESLTIARSTLESAKSHGKNIVESEDITENLFDEQE